MTHSYPDPKRTPLRELVTFGERRRAEQLVGYIETLLNDGGHAVYYDLDSSSRFVKFDATLVRVPANDTEASDTPARYRLTLTSSKKPGWFNPGSATVPAEKFGTWAEEVVNKITQVPDIAVELSEIHARKATIVLALEVNNPALAQALDGIIAQRNQHGVSR